MLVEVEEVVDGRPVRVEAGDELVADGRLEQADVSRSTSRSSPASRRPWRFAGRRGALRSFAARVGAYTVTAVGKESYAEKVADVARTFRHPRSPLERSLNRLLLVMVGMMVPLGAIFGYALFEAGEVGEGDGDDAVAGMVTLVPEGLILLASSPSPSRRCGWRDAARSPSS